MLMTVFSSCIKGVQGHLVQVEVDISKGLPAFALVGLPDAAVKESKDRVHAALKNQGMPFPMQRITINLAPADMKKEGPLYDLPIALGLMLSCGHLVPAVDYQRHMFVGELSLSGHIRPVRGVLPMVLSAKEAGFTHVVVPEDNGREASMVEGIAILPMGHLAQVVGYLTGTIPPSERPSLSTRLLKRHDTPMLDFADVRGQHQAKGALEVSAAGFHNVLLVGPPGSGKTMLAKRLPSILPDMDLDEALEVTKIHSIAGQLEPGGLMMRRPFRSPHHSITRTGLIGGGLDPKPGEITLAHLGVLFLDEMGEFQRSCLEVLRQPLEDKCIHLTRGTQRSTFPSFFLLAGSINPCPCGYYGDESQTCTCSPRQRQQYLSKISGPMLDRMDIQMDVRPVPFDDLAATHPGVDSRSMRHRVDIARRMQQERFAKETYRFNGQIPAGEVARFCLLTHPAQQLFQAAFHRLGYSSRGYHRLLRMARTIADLDECSMIQEQHMAQALQYRRMDIR